MAVVDFLNSREKAVALWTLAVLVYVFFKSDKFARQLLALLRTALAPKLVLPAVVAAAYSTGLVLATSRLGLWHEAEIKETIYWFFGTALVLVGGAISAQAFDRALARRLIHRALRGVLVIEFLVGIYVMLLPVELLFVPLVGLLVAMRAVNEDNRDLAQVQRLLDATLIVAGLGLAVYVMVRATANLNGLLTTERGESLLLIPTFTLALAPLLYAIAKWSDWDRQRVMHKRGFGDADKRSTRSAVA